MNQIRWDDLMTCVCICNSNAKQAIEHKRKATRGKPEPLMGLVTFKEAVRAPEA